MIWSSAPLLAKVVVIVVAIGGKSDGGEGVLHFCVEGIRHLRLEEVVMEETGALLGKWVVRLIRCGRYSEEQESSTMPEEEEGRKVGGWVERLFGSIKYYPPRPKKNDKKVFSYSTYEGLLSLFRAGVGSIRIHACK